MQGFNKYYPPDYDSRQTSSLNSYRGVHALGVRAKDIDKGILVVRFELPFNIWCGHCNSHLGAGVRYNAQKRKVGAYYTTPIYAFRCKCHLCSGWFEIRTDPKNAKYVVEEGAREQIQDWNPEENGGYAVHETDKPSAADPPADAFAQIEKTTQQKSVLQTASERLESLEALSYRQTSDPYSVSQHLRAHLRKERKDEKKQLASDDATRSRLGLGMTLLPPDAEEGKSEWALSSLNKPKSDLKTFGKRPLGETLMKNTARRYNPFDNANVRSSKLGRGKTSIKFQAVPSNTVPRSLNTTAESALRIATDAGTGSGKVKADDALGVLAGYGSEDE